MESSTDLIASRGVPAGPPDGSGPTSSRNLLLVDDEENVLRSLHRLLRRDGYNLHLANSVQMAFEVLSKHPIDVVVSDHRMPEQNGTDFLCKVKALYPQTVRLMLSGYTEVNSVTEAINEGSIYKFLTKPWDDDQLRANIREAFQRHAMESENIRLHREIEDVNLTLLDLNHALEQQLQDKNERIERDTSVAGVMQEMLDYLPLGVLGVDSAGEVVWVNRWAADLFQSSIATYIAQSSRLLPSPLPELIEDYLFGFDLKPQSHQVSMRGEDIQIQIKPMGLRSDSSGCLVLINRQGDQP